MRPLDRRAQAGLILRHLLGVPVNADDRSRLRAARSLIRLAYRRTTFYRELYDAAGIHPDDIRSWNDFHTLPVVTKDDLLTAGDACVVGGTRRRDFRSCSSGSSGKRLYVVQSPSFWVADSLIGVRELGRRFDYRRDDVSLYANTSAYPYTSIGGAYRFLYFDNLRSPEELYRVLLARRPSFLMAYPSILEEVADHVGDGLSGLGVKALVTHSEQSTPAQRDRLAELFGCPVFDEYATEECGRLALQCKFGSYHLIEAQSHMEILDVDTDRPLPDGSVGEVTATCLVNRRMPIIRYRHGDLAAVRPTACQCGIQGRVMTELAGRANDSFQLPDGTRLASGRLLDWSYSLLMADEHDVRQFQIRQTGTGEVEVLLVPGPRFDHARSAPQIVRSFQQSLDSRLPVTVHTVDELRGSGSGKHRPILRSPVHAAAASTGLPERG